MDQNENFPAFSPYTTIKVFAVVLILKILNGHLFEFLNNTYFHLESRADNLVEKNDLIFLAVIIGPIIETLIFQLGLNELLIKLKIKNYFLLLIIPSVLFASSHYYNWLYIILTFIGGLLLNWFYLYAKVNGKFYAFCWVVFTHSLYNLYGVLIDL